MISIKVFAFNPFSENTYVLYDETKEAIVVDPGNYDARESDVLTRYISDQGLKPVAIVNTHAHVDHVLGVFYLKNHYSIPFYLHPKEEPVLHSVKTYASNYGFHAFNEPVVDGWLQEGELFSFGSSTLRIVFVPGHAPGHIALIQDDQRFVIGGDVLFKNSIGRTDLPGGNYQTLIGSIKDELFILSDDFVVYPGHGGTTTIGDEKRYNPFLR